MKHFKKVGILKHTPTSTDQHTAPASRNSDLLCADCSKTFDVPFISGGKTRCAGCAADLYMKSPRYDLAPKLNPFVNPKPCA